MRKVHGETIHGVNVDAQTRCAHYHSALDVIAIKFKCCEKWFPCFECHNKCETHEAQVWAADEFQTKAILCGCCGHQLSIQEYFNCGAVCPECRARFNPNCALHYELYFKIFK